MTPYNGTIRSGINLELFKAISSPPDWANQLDDNGSPIFFLGSLKEQIETFLSATTDAVRLVRASVVSRDILDEYDMAELEDLRATVQASELLRIIPYSRQTDHSAHTLYLFLLGVYLFFACAPLREGIGKFLGVRDSKSPGLLARFLFQWVFVSLLHDIGYIFQGRSRNEIRAVDRMFRSSTVKRLLDTDDGGFAQRALEGLEIRPLEGVENPEDMLSILRYMPWGNTADFENDIFESFDVYGPRDQQISANSLEDYAYRVASSGYDGFSEGTVDHAVASGLFLFRYSTFWYWIAKRSGFKGSFAVFKDDGYPKGDVVCACFAAGAHNIIGVHAQDIEPLVFDKNPLLYLGVLCDELQKWDRFPAGERHLVDLTSFEKYCTDSERIAVEGGWDGREVILRFEEEELASGIKKALTRLDSVENFIKINPASPESDAVASEETAREANAPPTQTPPPTG